MTEDEEQRTTFFMHMLKTFSVERILCADFIDLCAQENVLDEIRENIQGLNQCCKPNHYIGEYAVFELLGTGAFGSVYKVRRCTARSSFLAMKEVNFGL